MDKEQDKIIDKLVDKLMKNDELSSTSNNFTDTVMSQIKELNQQEIYIYTPIISKKIWLIIGTFMAGFTGYLVFYGNLTKSKWMDYFEFDLNLSFLPSLSFSNTTLYATIIVSVLFFIQIVMLKHYFNKRLSI